MKHSMHVGILLSVAQLLAVSSLAFGGSYDISWTGSNGYTMTGLFEYSNNFSGTINGSQLNSFSIRGFKNGTSIGSWNPSSEQLSSSSFNFNFDTTTETLLTGGRSDSPTGQLWNVPNSLGLGFFSGNSSQGFWINGRFEHTSQLRIGSTVTTVGLSPSTLHAIPNPEPSTILLVGTGLAGLLLYRHRQQRSTSSHR